MAIEFNNTRINISDADTLDGKHATDFVLVNGTQSMTGTLNSILVTGTAPITVASTTMCTHLNADQVDGKEATAFVWVDGSQSMTNTLNSTLAIGTAPITVTSTTKCTNLNADKLDDLEGSAYITYDDTKYKQPVKCVTSANIDLTTGGLLTIDGYTVADGNRVLVKSQSTGSENGIYIAHSGTWLRSSDFANGVYMPSSIIIMVEQGTYQSCTGWTLSTLSAIVGTTTLTFENIIRRTSASATAFYTANRDGNGDITTRVFISNVATSTAPLTVASTTKVTNLNADKLDDLEAVDFTKEAQNVATIVTTTLDKTLTTTNKIVLYDPTGGVFAITLYSAVGNTGRQITFKNITSLTTTVTITPVSAQTIDGAATFGMSSSYQSCTIVSNGTNWYFI